MQLTQDAEAAINRATNVEEIERAKTEFSLRNEKANFHFRKPNSGRLVTTNPDQTPQAK